MSLEVIYHLRQEIKSKDAAIIKLKKANIDLLKQLEQLKKESISK